MDVVDRGRVAVEVGTAAAQAAVPHEHLVVASRGKTCPKPRRRRTRNRRVTRTAVVFIQRPRLAPRARRAERSVKVVDDHRHRGVVVALGGGDGLCGHASSAEIEGGHTIAGVGVGGGAERYRHRNVPVAAVEVDGRRVAADVTITGWGDRYRGRSTGVGAQLHVERVVAVLGNTYVRGTDHDLGSGGPRRYEPYRVGNGPAGTRREV